MVKRFRKFMVGRYGMDQLGQVLLLLALILSLINIRIALRPLQIVQIIISLFILYRIFSKNLNLRYEENRKFLKLIGPIRRKWNYLLKRISDRKDYKYFKCENCQQKLRVPKDKGRISITCPKCKLTMIKKT